MNTIPGNEKTLSDFWAFCNERHAIYIRRVLHSRKPPWTDDPLMANYRFTNIFRDLDAGSEWARDNLFSPNAYEKYGDIWLNAAAYRCINRISTAERLGWITTDPWSKGRIFTRDGIAETLRRFRADGPVFGSAYFPAYPRHPECDDIYDATARTLDLIAKWTREWNKSRMQMLVEYGTRELLAQWGIGPLRAWQIICDIVDYSDFFKDALDSHDYALAGPGARQGLKRLRMAPKLASMREIRDSQAEYWEHSRPLTVRDVEHALCEFEKYSHTSVLIAAGRQIGMRRFDAVSKDITPTA